MNSSAKMFLLKAYDLLIVACVAAVTSWAIDPGRAMTFQEFLAIRLSIKNFAIILVLILVWHAIFRFFNLYISRRMAMRLRRESFDVLKSTTLGTLVIMTLALVFEIKLVTPLFLLLFWVKVSTILIVSRLALRHMQRRLRRSGRNLKRVIIVGTNERAMAAARRIESKKDLGFRLVGFADDCWHQPPPAQGKPLVSDLSGFQAYLKDHIVDEVIICVPIKSFYDQASRVIAQCEEQGILVRFVSNVFPSAKTLPQSDQLDERYVVTLTTASIPTGDLILKRLMDFLISALLLAVLSPVFVVVALAIKATSRGPVFFVQKRIGLNKRKFHLYKFRTMVVGAEAKIAELEAQNEVSGPVFKITQDPRVTSVGRFLRKHSLDELPQFFNVLKGDMSLVGPRPLPIRDYQGFDKDGHRRRLSVRPGLTCLWQVGGRNAISFDKWMELDLQYIDSWSLWLDLKILLKTIPAVTRGAGAS